MNVQELMAYGKLHGPDAVKKAVEAMTPEQRKALVAPLCSAVNDLFKQFVPAAIDHIVEKGLPMGDAAKAETQDVLKRYTLNG